jgi:glycosyltransferase involved in cell wall biosynthesis
VLNVTDEITDGAGKVPVSFLIPIKNEAKNLPRCLGSIPWAGEIFVVDSKSTDGSEQIAESYGAKVVQFDFGGIWPKKKNWSLANLPLRYEWVFILDADEVLPPECRDEINEIVTGKNLPVGEPIVGYWINRRFFFLDKWLKHAYFPNWNLRLFKHKLGRYEKLTDIATASGDNEVHEHVVVEGKTGHLKSLMDHYAFPTVEVFIEKHNRYSNWEARVALSRDRQGKEQEYAAHTPDGVSVDWRRRLKLLANCLPFRPFLRFAYVYIWQKGFLDGIEGFYFARLHGFYEFLIVLKTFELKKAVDNENKN